MNFGLSEDQELLQKSAREFLARECPTSLVRSVMADAEGYPRNLYRQMAQLGWAGLIVPEAYGGAGLRILDLALLLEEMGRAVLPGPYLSSTLGIVALLHGGSAALRKAWLPRLAAGDAVATLAWLEEDDRPEAEGISARARKVRGEYRLSGSKLFVTDAHVADLIVIVLRTGRRREDVSAFAVPRDTPGVTTRLLDSIDLTRRMAEVEIEDVRVPAAAQLSGGWKTVQKVLDVAAVALAADSLGGAQAALEMAVSYSKVREQFGRPIGSFQAIKHMAAEMVSEVEPARALVWYAAYACDALPREASSAAAMAKARLTEIYSRTANRAVQIHGGIGFTWEHDMHLWFKRAKWNELAFGDPAFHRERVADLLF